MGGERVPLILKNKGNCLFCQSPVKSDQEASYYSLQPLLHSLQVKQVTKNVKVEGGRKDKFVEASIDGYEIKTGLCNGCVNLNQTFFDLKQKLKSCLATIKSRIKLGKEKNDGGMKYPIMEGAIMKETLARLNRKEPRVILQDLPRSERSVHFGTIFERKVDAEGNTTDTSSPIIPEADNQMEVSSSTHPRKRRKVVRPRGRPMNTLFHAMDKRSNSSKEYIVQAIEKKKVVKGRVKYLVKWMGYKERSWLPAHNLLPGSAALLEDFEKSLTATQRVTRAKRKEPDIESGPPQKISRSGPASGLGLEPRTPENLKKWRKDRARLEAAQTKRDPGNARKGTFDITKVYCYCNRPTSFDPQMAQCENCEEWFHFKCLKLTPLEQKRLSESDSDYICSTCQLIMH